MTRAKTVGLILVTELCERFAFYGFVGSLTYFFMSLGLRNNLSSVLNNLFSSVVYVTPVIGAYVADVWLGRYATILSFCMLYIVGLLLTTAGAWPSTSEGSSEVGSGEAAPPFQLSTELARVLSVVGLFVFVSLGAGGIKSNVVVLGADQFDLPAEAADQAAFFNWFYWSINIGATAAYLLLTNLALHGLPLLGIDKQYGFFASFCVPTAAFAIGVLTFRCGRARYKTQPPEGSAVTAFLATLSRRWRHGRGRWLRLAAWLLPLSFALIVASSFVPDTSRRMKAVHDGVAITGLGFIALGMGCLAYAGSSVDWLYDGGQRASASDDEHAAANVVRILPLSTCVVVFWVIYSQMSSNFQLQGCYMNLLIGPSIKLSPATLNVFDSIVIMLLIPVIDRAVYPLLGRCGIELAMTTKIACGFGFAAASVLCAGLVESARRQSPLLTGDGRFSSCPTPSGASRTVMHDFSIWWQTPQYLLIGLGEIFAAITCYELFYSEVPRHMRSVCQSINLLCTSFGSLAAAGLNSALAAWIPPDLDHGHLDYVFYTLAALMAANTLLFLALAADFERRAAHERIPSVTGTDGASWAGGTPHTERNVMLMNSSGALDFLEPGMLLGARSTGSFHTSSRLTRRTSSHTTTGAPSEHRRTSRSVTGGSEQLGDPLLRVQSA